jgi:hypothetical protein
LLARRFDLVAEITADGGTEELEEFGHGGDFRG